MDRRIKNGIRFLVISILVAVCYMLFACENPFMDEILEPKTITFESNGGSPVQSQKLIKGESIKRPDNPYKANYIFLGWFQDNGTFFYEWNFLTIPRSSFTLFAKWSEPIRTDNFAITIAVPMTGEIPAAEASIYENYTIEKISWSPDDEVFQSSTQYTVTITVKANDGGKFTDSISATINNNAASVIRNDGYTVTVSYKFAPTLARPLSSISIKTSPERKEYTHGDKLDLSGLVVLLIYTDESTEEVELSKFNEKGITTAPANGEMLFYSENSEQHVTVTLGNSFNYIYLTVYKAAAQIGSGDSTKYYRTLNDAIYAAPTGTADNPTVITLLDDIVSDTGYNIDGKHIKLIPEAWQNRTITFKGGYSILFDIGTESSSFPSATLNLDGGSGTLTINGDNPNNNNHGINVNLNGTLEMNNNVIITGFKGGGVILYDGKFTMNGGSIENNKSESGGGVFVLDTGTFTMNGGKIKGNNANMYGGGVYIENGTFNMNGGEISGNSADISGGGVCVLEKGIFYMSNGIIYGTDEEDIDIQNKADTCAVVFSASAITEYGVFFGETWASNGNLPLGSDTIEVKDGKLVRPKDE
jgi:uncharacterized repeat protein (TIGR02543 family)